MPPTVPIFDFSDTFDAEIAIGEKKLQIHVKRYSKAELEAFDKGWDEYVVEVARGTAVLTPDETAARNRKSIAFMEDVIKETITVDAGLVRDRGKDVTDGAGLIDIFHASKEVLAELIASVWLKNHLTDVLRKNSNSPRDSDTGSATSIPTHGGDGQGPIAASAASSSTAAAAVATDAHSPNQAEPSVSSGASTDGIKIH